MKIVFMGTPEFAVRPLEELSKRYELTVITQTDKKSGRGKKLQKSPVKKKAEELGLSVHQPENINDEEFIQELKSFNADIFVVVAFGQILKQQVLDIPKYGAINIHASLLPKLRGAAPINRAILDGEEYTGISIMKMERGLDTGDVALCGKTEILDKNAEELAEELSEIGAKLICEFMEKLEKAEITFTPQDDSKSTYAQKITKETQTIDFLNMTTDEILRLIRAMYDRGGAFTVYRGERLKIFRAEKLGSVSLKEIGEINPSLEIKTRDGAIKILELQFPGKKRMDAKSFLLGNKIENDVLGG